LLYCDKLIGPAAWPNLAAQYRYASDALTISLSLSTNAYLDKDTGQATAERDFQLYAKIWYQLNQDYGANSPLARGQAIVFALHNGLLVAPDLVLNDAQTQTFRDFVNQTLAYLAAVQTGQGGTPPAVAPLSIPIGIEAVAPGNILPLTLTLTLSCQGLLVDSALAGLADSEISSMDILPMPDSNGGSGSGYSQFAAQFEAMFVARSEGWSLKLGTSPVRGEAADRSDRRTQSLWAVRFADTPLAASPNGLGFALTNLPLFYAPLPLATSVISDTFTIYPAYDGTQPYPPAAPQVKQSFTGVDPNVWFQVVLDAVDRALAPDLAAALYLLDKSQGVPDPLSSGALGALLAAKHFLADNISETVQPILEPVGASSPWPRPDPASQKSARETLRQALLNQLGPAFSTTAIVVFQANSVAGGALNLYGKPRATLAEAPGADVNATFALSTARLSLDPSNPAHLGFLLDSRNVAAASAAFLSLKFDWEITHVEHAIRSGPGIAEHTDRDWINFIIPFASPAFNPDGAGVAQPIDVPVLLRALPQPPTMRAQTGDATFPAATTPSEMAQWNYRVDFTYDRAAQDSIATEIDLNLAPGSLQTDGSDPASALQAALAQFVQVYPAVAQAMTAALDAINTDGPDPAAANPVQWFIAILQNVTQAYDAWMHPVSAPHAPASLLPEVKLTFEIELVPAAPTDPATVAINGLAINGEPAILDAARTTITAPIAGMTLPLPMVEIQPDLWTAAITSAAGQSNVRFGYTAGTMPVTYEQAAAIGTRSLVIHGLNIFGYRNGQTNLQILRNEHLLPDSAPPAATNNAFIFRTPVVQFESPAAPSLSFPDLAIDGLVPAGSTYEAYLVGFFTGLATGMIGTIPTEAAATVTYSYCLVPGEGAPRTVVPVSLMLHTPGAISTDAAPDFVGPLAGAVESWRTSHQPTTDGDATIDMMLALYPARNGEQQPMLRVERIFVTAADAPPTGV
jgi:hypothetical protein